MMKAFMLKTGRSRTWEVILIIHPEPWLQLCCLATYVHIYRAYVGRHSPAFFPLFFVLGWWVDQEATLPLLCAGTGCSAFRIGVLFLFRIRSAADGWYKRNIAVFALVVLFRASPVQNKGGLFLEGNVVYCHFHIVGSGDSTIHLSECLVWHTWRRELNGRPGTGGKPQWHLAF